MAERTNVLSLIKGLGSGGAEKLLEMSLGYLNQRDFHYQVAYYLPKKNALVPKFEEAGIRTHCFNISRPYDPRSLWKLARFLRKEDVEILHIHSPSLAVYGRLAGRLAGVKAIIYTEHNIVDRYHPLTKMFNVLTYPMNDVTIAISDAVSRSIIKWKTVRKTHVYTILNGIDYAAIKTLEIDRQAIRESLGIKGRQLVVGTVAHIQPQKGYPYLIEAARLVLEHYPDTTFIIVGGEKHRGDRQKLEEIVKEKGINDHIIFAGARSDALRVMASFDIFVLPSVWEGFGIVFLEAMALGKPVIGTRVGGIPEIIEDGVNGYLVEPQNPRQIADKIMLLLGDSSLRSRMGEKGRQRVEDKFCIEDMVSSVEGIYRSTLAARETRKS